MRFSHLAITTLLTITTLPVHAAGYGFEYQSTRASARGNVSTAGSGAASMLHYNPAALVLGDRDQIEANFFFPKGSIKAIQGGQSYHADDDWLFAGSLFYSHPFKIADRKMALGLGVRAPYGQEASWPQSAPFSPFGFDAEIKHLEYLIGGAIELDHGFSIGANIFFADSEISTSAARLVLPTDFQSFIGKDEQWGYQIALHHQVTSQFSWGINYRSGFDLNYEGSIDYTSGNPLVPDASFPATSPLDFPDHLTIGCEWQVRSNLSLGLQAQWTDWSAVDAFEVSTPVGVTSQPVNWNSNWNLSLGGTWSASESLDIHFGCMFTESLIDEPFNTPLNGDFEQHFFSTGFTYRHNDWTFDLAIIRLAEADHQVSQSLYGFTGKHESDGWFLNAGVACRF